MTSSDDTAGDTPFDVPRDLPESTTQSYDPLKSAMGNHSDRSTFSLEERKLGAAGSPGDMYDTRNLTLWSVTVQEDSKAKIPTDGGQLSYVLRRCVGRGGFGEVWESVQVSLGRFVAVKRLREDLLKLSQMEGAHESTAMADSFRMEAFTTAALDHPNIVPVYDLGVDGDGRPLMAMKLVKGRPWGMVMARDYSHLPYEEHLDKHIPILIDVAQAVAFAHSRGIVHRDLKPSQVITGDFGEVLLMDWGLAIWHDQEKAEKTRSALPEEYQPATRLRASSPAGTVAYMAPEQTEKSAGNIGPWTDVYLLGGILYEILTNKTPHDGVNSQSMFRQASEGYIVPLEKAVPGKAIPIELVDICRRALQRRREDRFTDANEFLQSLRDYLTGATKRRESTALLDRAGRALLEAEGSYQGISEAIALIGQAAGQWSANPQIAPLMSRALSEHARAALGNGDLALARLQAERLEDSDPRRLILADVEAAERRTWRNNQIRKWAVVAAILFLTIGVVSGSILNVKRAAALEVAEKERDEARKQRNIADTERDKAEKQREIAVQAKVDAVERLKYLMVTLYPRLNELGSFDLMEITADHAIQYYASHPEEAEDKEALAVRSSAHQAMGVVLSRRGERDAALGEFEKALRIRKGVDSQSRSIRSIQDIAGTLLQIAQIKDETGDRKGAVETYQEAIQAADEMINLAPETATSYGQAVVCRMQLSEAYFYSSQMALGEEVLEQAYQLSQKALSLDSNDLESQELVARCERILARNNGERGNSGKAIEYLEHAKDFYEGVARSDPSKQAFLREAQYIYLDLALLHWKEGNAQESLKYYNAAYAPLKLLKDSTVEVEVIGRFGGLLNERAEVLNAIGDRAAAVADCQESAEVYRELIPRDPKSERWPNSLAWTLCVQGQILTAMGKTGEAKIAFEEGASIIKPLAEHSDVSEIIGTYAFLLLYLDRLEEARPYVVKLRAVGWTYPGFDELARKVDR